MRIGLLFSLAAAKASLTLVHDGIDDLQDDR